MTDDSHTAYDPYPTAAMDRQHRDRDDEYAKLWQMYGDMEDKYDRLREALKTCRAYAVHPVSLDDCFVIFNAADAALQEANDE